jgi:transposase
VSPLRRWVAGVASSRCATSSARCSRTGGWFATLFPGRGRPAEAPWRLALVTVLQFAEGLSDRAAADAVRSRLDWKYLLGLELHDPGFDHSILSRFRDRLVVGGAEMLLLDALVDRCREAGLLRDRADARTDSTHVLSAARRLLRLELAGEAMRLALEAAAAAAPGWLAAHGDREWPARYARRFGPDRQRRSPAAVVARAERIGADGLRLLELAWGAAAPAWLRELPAIDTLRRIWLQQFMVDADGAARWRRGGNLPPAGARIDTPHDPEARYGVKAGKEWVGYKVHLTETCGEGRVHLVTHVDTTEPSINDQLRLLPIQDALSARRLAPARHLVDGGYVGGRLAVESRDRHGIALVGPAKANAHRARRGRFTVDAFRLDWEARIATCPEGKRSRTWWDYTDPAGRPFVYVKFSRGDCRSCACSAECLADAARNPRKLSLRPRAEHEAIQAARLDQETSEWRRIYDRRAGVEGTISQAVRVAGLRRSRYRGHAKTHLQHVGIACAINLQRITDALLGRAPAHTRTSHLAMLAN